MLSLGLDIGGANTKVALLGDGEVRRHWLRYIPLWKEKENLVRFLGDLAGSTSPEVVGVTMTAELCDIFSSKREGVTEMIEIVTKAFGDDVCLFMSLDGTLLKRDEALTSFEKLAAANWVASALIVGRKYPNCILMDVGSTTTDVIPLKDGKLATVGQTDFQRLGTGELCYTGVLRTPLPFISHKLRFSCVEIGIASENFAIMADVYRVLDMLDEADYTCETPDGRGKDTKSCMQRVARVLCSDLDEVGKELVVEAAKLFHEKQVTQVVEALTNVMRRHAFQTSTVVGCGLGRKILAKKVAKIAGLADFVDLADVYGEGAALMTPAYAVGVLAMEAVDGGGCA